jgi:hypothetical protein
MRSVCYGLRGRIELRDQYGITPGVTEVVTELRVEELVRGFLLARRHLRDFAEYFHGVMHIDSESEYAHVIYLHDIVSWPRLAPRVWYRLNIRGDELNERWTGAQLNSDYIERAWHGFNLESLSSMLEGGLLASDSTRIGARFDQGRPGLHCSSDDWAYLAMSYSNSVPCGGNLFMSCMWELLVDRDLYVPCRCRRGWIQPVSSVRIVALWVRVRNFQDIQNGDNIQGKWEALFEYD